MSGQSRSASLHKCGMTRHTLMAPAGTRETYSGMSSMSRGLKGSPYEVKNPS
eukprot:CAMPEP_0171287952 /NCGR_PEP_ID=MMETSP0790-20130122/69847_1 /TAXON_ID=2925 /ORGANISM="Alexandrium catenella, Strain OF101" /LENGTH=51 /DNA_ID=CAMNT_0011757551 /DNA_START=54 /DNA_END=209 /DNA_ORIENTATION=+